MSYEKIKKLKPNEFKRFCGVTPELFQEMVEVLKPTLPQPKPRGGQPKLTIQDQLLMALEDWREYRTYFHLAQSWGIHDSTVCRIIHRIEHHLIQSQKFRLPGNKALQSAQTEVEVVIVDVGESPIQRPIKNSVVTTVGKRKDTLSSLNW